MEENGTYRWTPPREKKTPNWKKIKRIATLAVVILVALVLTVIMYFYLTRSKQGYEIAVVGESERTARYVGIKVGKVIVRTMMLSGAVCGLAGLLLALGLLSGAPYGLVSRVSYADISWPVLLGGAAVFYGLLHLLFRQTARHERGELMDIDVVVGGRRCRLRALRDNGNTLRDPIRGQPVLVAEAAALRRLWPAETAEILGRAVPPEEKMALLHRAGVDIPFVLLPFRAVGTEGGLLLACRSDYVQIGRRSVMHTLVALTDTQVGAGGYQALWGGREKGDSHDTVAAACTMDPTAGQAG